ncbi:MAG TPA: class I SAM-dependent methyltransferase [Deltaproteobacteria bacterium]|nr:class I SAM-dependent methyltransferase [Deltaproteobacteria bacterium]
MNDRPVISPFESEARDFDDWFFHNRNVFESELKATARFVTDPERTLSVGAGSGIFDERLGIQHGVEPAAGMAELARQRGINVKIGNAEDLPYPDGSFRGILLNTVLSYVSDRPRAVAEAARVLEPGGHIIVSYICREGSYAMLYDLAVARGKHDPEAAPPVPYPLKFMQGTHWCSTDEIISLLNGAGFKDLDFVQTLTRHPRYSVLEVEEPVPGYDRGDYVVVRGTRK